jgi:Ca2+-transporting ATPase
MLILKIKPKRSKKFNSTLMWLITQEDSSAFICHESLNSFISVVGMARGASLQDLVYVGLVGICDPPRPFVRESIQTLLQSGVKVKLVTGDAQETATAIGKSQRCVK